MIPWVHVHFDAALNLVWLCLGASMLAIAAYYSVRPNGMRRPVSWLQLVGVLAIAGTVFPYVSATDDLVWMDSTTSRAEHQSSNRNDRNDSNSSNRVLIGLWQAADASILTGAVKLACTFVFIALLALPRYSVFGFQRQHVSGRSPPQLLRFSQS